MQTKFLNPDDKRRIAHFIAEKSVSNIGSGEPNKMLTEYVNTFNIVLEKLDKEEF